MSIDQTIEQEIQAKGADQAPRVTLADIEASISSEHYFTAYSAILRSDVQTPVSDINALRTLTFCVLVLRNGFTVTGTSACASPENFDAEIGRKVARQDAVRQVWPLLGYALKERLQAEQLPDEARILADSTALMLRGMTLDPAIPEHAKQAMRLRVDQLEAFAEKRLA